MEEEEIDVVSYDANAEIVDRKTDFQCDTCDWVGRSEKSLNAHQKQKHSKSDIPDDTTKRTRGRPRKGVDNSFDSGPEEEQKVYPQRVTTKQLLGGRKRPKTSLVDSVDESALRTDREASRLHELGVIDEDTSLGDYVRHGANYQLMAQGMNDDDAAGMIVGEEVVIGDRDEEDDNEVNPNDISLNSPVKPRHTSRRFTEKLSNRLTKGDPYGKYQCYIAECDWKGGYRSLRMDHMKAIHPDWKMPSRYLLERISKDGLYLNPDGHIPPFACNVEGCDWRGNYRASRSSHMRKVHPKEHAEKKKCAPGYNSNGNYSCHYPLCTWRGWSRSTRSAHLKKAHPEWRPEDTRIMMALSCFYCKNTFGSYDSLCNHISTHGGIGLHVSEIFSTKQEFANFLQRIERTYSITFERNDLSPPPDDIEPDLQHYVLHCNCAGGRGVQLALDARNYVYPKHHYLKRRSIHLVTRTKNDCSAHLEIREDTPFGPFHVKGYLEHTGHRFGTPLLRMSSMDRQLYCDVLEWKLEHSFQFNAMQIIEKLNQYEGFQMDNYAALLTFDLIDPLDSHPLSSLRKLVEQSDPDCLFGVDFSEFGDGNVCLGYMTVSMGKLYKAYGPKRTITLDVMLVEFDDIELTQFTILVNDENNVPKCAMLFLTTEYETAPAYIFQQMVKMDAIPPKEIITDISEAWVDAAARYFKTEQPTILISEWHLMDYWSGKVEELVDNEYDMFCLIAGLRRFLRVSELHQMQAYIVEIQEALYESGYEEFAEFFDYQLSDVAYSKRWSPLQRSSFTSHAHPYMAVAAKTLRDLYLANDDIDRVDQWFAHVSKRVHDFNAVVMTQTFTLRPLEGPRKFFYNQVTTDENGVEHQIQHAEYQAVMYDEGILAGEVVEEEIIGHEIREIVEEEEDVVEEVEELEEVVDEMELQEGEEIIYEEIDESELVLRQEFEGGSRETSAGPSSPAKIPPHRLHMYQRKEPESPSKSVETPDRGDPIRRETTKSVIRSRKRKERFAPLKDCPPEVMRAIAAHAISYDGRKKEQKPFVYVPVEAKMASGTQPAREALTFKHYGTYPSDRMMNRRPGGGDKKEDELWEIDEEASATSPTSSSASARHARSPVYEQVPEYVDDPSSSSIYHDEEEYAPESLVVHHEEIQMEHEEPDDQQPCTSASMYR